jgi:hypothetical protein
MVSRVPYEEPLWVTRGLTFAVTMNVFINMFICYTNLSTHSGAIMIHALPTHTFFLIDQCLIGLKMA